MLHSEALFKVGKLSPVTKAGLIKTKSKYTFISYMWHLFIITLVVSTDGVCNIYLYILLRGG